MTTRPTRLLGFVRVDRPMLYLIAEALERYGGQFQVEFNGKQVSGRHGLEAALARDSRDLTLSTSDMAVSVRLASDGAELTHERSGSASATAAAVLELFGEVPRFDLSAAFRRLGWLGVATLGVAAVLGLFVTQGDVIGTLLGAVVAGALLIIIRERVKRGGAFVEQGTYGPGQWRWWRDIVIVPFAISTSFFVLALAVGDGGS